MTNIIFFKYNIIQITSRIILLLYCIITFSCTQDFIRPKETKIYGKIINPKYDTLSFIDYDRGIEIKTNITSNNEFNFSLDSLIEGQYYIQDIEEYQDIYIVPGDSIFIRYNTWNYDETFSFEGRGGKRNEILLHNFLENERLLQLKGSLITWNPDRILKFTDSILSVRKQNLKQLFETKNEYRSDQLETKMSNTNLGIYLLREYYTFHKQIKDSIYYKKLLSHRNHIDINDRIFNGNEFGYTYLHMYFMNNLDPSIHKQSKDIVVFELLKSIKKDMNNVNSKINLATEIIFSDFYEDSLFVVAPKNKALFRTFTNESKDQGYLNSTLILLDTKDKIKEGSKIPNFKIKNLDKTTLHQAIKRVNKKQIITFFPSGLYPQEYLFSKISELIKKYPNYDFIIIDSNKNPETLNFAKEHEIENYFLLDQGESIKAYLNTESIRTIITDKNGIVLNNFTNIHADFFESQL